MSKTLLIREKSSRPLLGRWILAAALVWLGFIQAAAQANLYTFSASTGATLEDMSTGTTSLVAASSDDGRSVVTAIGFPFTYAGTAYTDFSANVNGLLRLGTARVTTDYDNSTFGFGEGSNSPKLAPYFDDLHTGSVAGGGKVHYKLFGSAPNRKLVVEWFVTVPRSTTGTANSRFQLWLNETTNSFDYVYGAISANTAFDGASVGHATSATVYQSVTTSSSSISTSTPNNNNTTAIAAGTRYSFVPPVPCTAPPTAGTTVATPAAGCTTVTSLLSLAGSATGTGVTYQWQQSATGTAGTYANVSTGGTGATYTATGITSSTYFQALVTCSGQTATSTPVQVVVNPIIPAYAALPVTEGFENWLSRCASSEVPTTNWRAVPTTGNASWRREDQGFSTATWSFIDNEPAPYSTPASQGSHSARFHSFGLVSGTGSLDLFVDLSAAGTKTLTFDYINPTGTDVLDVLLSTDGGVTFGSTPLLSVGTSSAFGGKSVTFTSTSATSVIRFRATTDYGADDIGIDKLLLQVTPACPGVAFSPNTNITSTSATVNFAASPGATSYTVNYTPGGTAQTVTSAGAVPLTGLLPYTLYTVTVTTNCGAQSGTATTSFRTAIGNNECTGAVALTPGAAGAGCNAQTYTTSGATASVVTSSCTAVADGDVWFSFVAGGTRHSITVTPTFDFDAVIELRSGTCPGTSVSCQDASGDGGGTGAETLIAAGLTPGATYLVRVYSAVSGASSGNFDICITTPANLPCAQVTNAAVVNTGSTSTASTATLTFDPAPGATDYYITLAPTAGGTTTPATLPGSPVNLNGLTPNTSYTITITTNCSNGGVSSTVSVVFTSAAAPTPPANDDCAGATSLTVQTGTCAAPATGTNVGATSSTGAPAPACSSYTGGDVWFSFVVPPSGTVTVETGSITGSDITDTGLVLYSGTCGALATLACDDDSSLNGNFSLITQSGLTPGSTIYARVFDYDNAETGQFTICVTTPAACAAPTAVAAGSVTLTSASISFTAGNGNTGYTVTATPATGPAITATGSASPIALPGLTASTQYSVTVTGTCSGGQTATSTPAVTFTTASPPPANDLCSGAIAVACGQTVTGSTAGATTTGDPTSSCNTTVTSQGGVFYSFTGTGDIVTASTCAGPTATSGDTKLFVYSGTCGALTCVDGNDDSSCGGNGLASLVTFPSVLGTQYYIFVQGFDAVVNFGLSLTCTAPITNLVVSSPQNVSGTYNNVTVQSGGVATLTGPLTVNGALTVQSGGVLVQNCQPVTGPGSFALQIGGELQICDAAGIVPTGATGAIQVAGTRSYASDASYTYNGTAAQTNGAGLPATVRNLTVNNTNGLTLTQALRIAQVARLQSGNLTLNGNTFTLLSSAAGTALVDNTGGSILGAGTMQRAVTNAVTGPAYRHFSSPVQNTSLTDLTTTGFAPTFNAAYNSSATPNLVTPFPTVFGYDQARLATVTSTYGAFDKGWFSPTGSGDLMLPTRGYTVNAPATATPIDFVGTFNNTTQSSGTLSRGTDANAGWQLLGNPYPAPLDWSTVTAAQRPGMDGAMYVYQSTGQYAGTYRSFDNGIGASPMIDAGSGYFARVTATGTPGAVNLTNANRITTFGAQPAFGRGANDTRPQLHLLLAGAGLSDETYLYLEQGATAGIDAQYDATKLSNPAGLDLASLSGTTPLAINGLAPLTNTDVVIPLTLRVPQAGSFSFEVGDLANFGSGTVYLRDAVTGTQLLLASGTRYQFALATATAGTGRFSVVFRAAAVTANKAELNAGSVSLYPNPSHGSFTVLLPPLAGQREVRATLVNALGQVVLTRTIGLTAAGATAEFTTRQLATGIYTLKLQAENQALTKRVVVE